MYINRTYEDAERSVWEDQIRTINTFIFNSNPYLKNQHRIKDPKKLYMIYSERLEEENKAPVKYQPLSESELEFFKSIGVNLN